MPFDLDCADRDWRRDYSPAQLEALERRARKLSAATATPGTAPALRAATPAREPRADDV